MAKQEGVKVEISGSALAALDEIQIWTADHFGATQARHHRNFLLQSLNDIATGARKGHSVEVKPQLSFIVARWSGVRGSGGHVIIYEIAASTLRVWAIYHTAQDWESHFRPK